MSKPFVPVAVVIPCFNCEATIDRAVQSVTLQTVRPSEIILVNDCSTDNTKTILLELQQVYSKENIRVIDLAENSGPGVARNAGWDAAASEYLAFLDADDSWHEEKLQVQYKWMMDHSDFCMSGHASSEIYNSKSKQATPEDGCEMIEIFAKSLFLTNGFPTRSVMLKRCMAVRFKTGKRYAEDYLLWLRIVLTQGRCAFLTRTLAYSYKPSFGSSGLSASLWRMQKGEISAFRDLYSEKLITFVEFFRFSIWSCIKFVRRLVIAAARNE